MPKASEVAAELRMFANALDRNPDAELDAMVICTDVNKSLTSELVSFSHFVKAEPSA